MLIRQLVLMATIVALMTGVALRVALLGTVLTHHAQPAYHGSQQC